MPEHREKDVARWILVESKKVMSDWSLKNPDLELMGFAAVIQSSILHGSEIHRFPRWPITGMSVMSYTKDGDQVRMVWFDHAVLPKGGG